MTRITDPVINRCVVIKDQIDVAIYNVDYKEAMAKRQKVVNSEWLEWLSQKKNGSALIVPPPK